MSVESYTSKIAQQENNSNAFYEFALVMIKPIITNHKEARITMWNKLSEYGEICAIKVVVDPDKAKMEQLYEEHKNKDFYDPLITIMCGDDKVIDLIILKNPSCQTKEESLFVNKLKKEFVGPTDPINTKEGQLRHLVIKHNLDYKQTVKNGFEVIDNGIHCSGDSDTALKETSIWFAQSHPEFIKQLQEQLTSPQNSIK